MTTEGIEAVFLETHNWGKAAKFFQALGYELEFETDHNSGQLRNGDGPYRVHRRGARRAADSRCSSCSGVADADAFRARPDRRGGRRRSRPTHWGTEQMIVRDPDGRLWSLQAPARG